MARTAAGNSVRSSRRFLLVLISVGFLLLAWGAYYGVLLLWGRPQIATIDYSVRQYGSSRGGTVYKVNYSFRIPGGTATYQGSAFAGIDVKPAGQLQVRYLAAFPSIHHPGSNGMLGFYAALAWIPGLLLTAFGFRAIRYQSQRTQRPIPPRDSAK